MNPMHTSQTKSPCPVVFHVHVADVTNHVCRLVHIAQKQKPVPIWIHGTPPFLAALSARLWEFQTTSFLAHAVLDFDLGVDEKHDQKIATRHPTALYSAVVLAPHLPTSLHQSPPSKPQSQSAWVFLNAIADAKPITLTNPIWSRVIDVVPYENHTGHMVATTNHTPQTNTSATVFARQRWRHYQQQGAVLSRFDALTKKTTQHPN